MEWFGDIKGCVIACSVTQIRTPSTRLLFYNCPSSFGKLVRLLPGSRFDESPVTGSYFPNGLLSQAQPWLRTLVQAMLACDCLQIASRFTGPKTHEPRAKHDRQSVVPNRPLVCTSNGLASTHPGSPCCHANTQSLAQHSVAELLPVIPKITPISQKICSAFCMFIHLVCLFQWSHGSRELQSYTSVRTVLSIRSTLMLIVPKMAEVPFKTIFGIRKV